MRKPKKIATKKTAKKSGRHPGPKPSVGWPKDIAKAAYVKAGGGDRGEKAARASVEKYEVANHRLVRWFTDPNEFKAALKADKAPSVKKTVAKKSAPKTTAKKTAPKSNEPAQIAA